MHVSYIGFSYYQCISATFRKKRIENFSTRVSNPPFQYPPVILGVPLSKIYHSVNGGSRSVILEVPNELSPIEDLVLWLCCFLFVALPLPIFLLLGNLSYRLSLFALPLPLGYFLFNVLIAILELSHALLRALAGFLLHLSLLNPTTYQRRSSSAVAWGVMMVRERKSLGPLDYVPNPHPPGEIWSRMLGTWQLPKI